MKRTTTTTTLQFGRMYNNIFKKSKNWRRLESGAGEERKG